MRILLVSHNYPPAHTAGVEQHTAQVTRELARRGHEVSVFTAEKDISRRDGSLVDRVHDGVAVRELTNNLGYDDFDQTWDWPPARHAFEEHLERVRPEVVHFQHLMHLSVGCVEAAARRGCATIFTLHDYWLQCPRFGQRLHPDGSICERIDFERCGACLTSFKFRQGALERQVARRIADFRSLTGVDWTPMARRIVTLIARGEPKSAAPDPGQASGFARKARERSDELRARIAPHVQRFIAPSRFLRERMLEWGLPPERVELMRMGAERDRFAAHPRRRRAGEGDAPLQVLFLGTFAPHKGPMVLLDAWCALASDLRASARLALHGSGAHYPAYVEALKRGAEHAGAEVGGVLARDEIAARLSSCDLLVMPSVWWENAPLVLIEAVAARTPILVSDLGGMAEFVHERSCGATFAPGDARDLTRALSELLGDRARLASFYGDGAEAPGMAECVERMERIYREALEERKAKR